MMADTDAVTAGALLTPPSGVVYHKICALPEIVRTVA